MSGSHYDFYVLDIDTFERVQTEESTLAVNVTCTSTPVSVNMWSQLIHRHATAGQKKVDGVVASKNVKTQKHSFQVKPNAFSGMSFKDFVATHTGLKGRQSVKDFPHEVPFAHPAVDPRGVWYVNETTGV